MCLLSKARQKKPKHILELSFASSLRLFLALYARLLIMLALFDFRQHAVFCNRAFKAAKSSINSLIFANFSFRHQFPLPPTTPSKSITRLINFHYRRILKSMSMLIKKSVQIRLTCGRVSFRLPRRRPKAVEKTGELASQKVRFPGRRPNVSWTAAHWAASLLMRSGNSRQRSELGSAEQMKMQMGHRLSSVGTAVVDQAVSALRDTKLCG